MGFEENMRDITLLSEGDPPDEDSVRQSITTSAKNLIAEYSEIYSEELRNSRYNFPMADEHKQAHYDLICKVVRFIPGNGGTTAANIEQDLKIANLPPNVCTATTCAVLLNTSQYLGLQTSDVINTTSAQGLHDAIQTKGVPMTDLRENIPDDFRVKSGDIFFEYGDYGKIKHSFIMHHVDYREDGTVEMLRIDGGKQLPHQSSRPFPSVAEFNQYLLDKNLVHVDSYELMKTLNPDQFSPILDSSPADLARENQPGTTSSTFRG